MLLRLDARASEYWLDLRGLGLVSNGSAQILAARALQDKNFSLSVGQLLEFVIDEKLSQFFDKIEQHARAHTRATGARGG